VKAGFEMEEEINLLLINLQSISPLPDDKDIDEEGGADLLEQYDTIINSLTDLIQGKTQYIPKIVPTLLDSFGVGDGFGVSWGTLHLIESFGDGIYPYIHQGLQSINAGTRAWGCYLLGRRRDKADIPLLIHTLQDQNSEVVIKTLQALRMLAQNYSLHEVIEPIKKLIQDEHENVRYAAEETLKSMI